MLTREQGVDRVLAGLRGGLLTQPQTLEQWVQEMADLCFLQNDIDWETVRVDQPFNTKQVRAGGFAMLTASMSQSPDVQAMRVDAVALGKDLAQGERIRRLRKVFDPICEALDANETVVQNRIANRVSQGLDRGWSMIKNNADLLRVLRPAVAIRGEPAAQAQQSRTAGERRDETVRTEEQAKMAGATGEAVPPPATVTTVTTPAATPPAAGPQKPVAPRPAHGGHPVKKPGQ